MSTSRKGKKKSKEAVVPVNSFSDIAFLLIIFFILAATLEHLKGFIADIPAGEKTEVKQEKTPIIQLRGKKIIFNDNPVDTKTLRKELAKLKLGQKKGNDKVILLEATGLVSYQDYFDVMSTISAAGGTVAIVKEEKGKGEGK